MFRRKPRIARPDRTWIEELAVGCGQQAAGGGFDPELDLWPKGSWQRALRRSPAHACRDEVDRLPLLLTVTWAVPKRCKLYRNPG